MIFVTSPTECQLVYNEFRVSMISPIHQQHRNEYFFFSFDPDQLNHATNQIMQRNHTLRSNQSAQTNRPSNQISQSTNPIKLSDLATHQSTSYQHCQIMQETQSTNHTWGMKWPVTFRPHVVQNKVLLTFINTLSLDFYFNLILKMNSF